MLASVETMVDERTKPSVSKASADDAFKRPFASSCVALNGRGRSRPLTQLAMPQSREWHASTSAQLSQWKPAIQ